MNHDGSGRVGDAKLLLRQPPREINVVARRGKCWIESAGSNESLARDRHVASAHLRKLVLAGAHLARSAGRCRDRGSQGRVWPRWEIRPAGSRGTGAPKRLDKMV